ncbi:MAG: hypothetical protein QMD46_02650 [Methanomicrobiales archaeon]|nr:hypothetical protein [Methanomicrobiales archaeon]MDI6875339.1 hypothetical protein [Methanomicrobiales archaeon]
MVQEKPSIAWIILSKTIGIILFLVVLAIITLLAGHVNAPLFSAIVGFLWLNAGLLVFIAVMFLIAEVFSAFAFPLNLPAPFFSATASIFLVAFLFRIFRFVDELYNLDVFRVLEFVEPLVYPFLFLGVLIFGYIDIFSRLSGDRSDEGRRQPERAPAEGKTWEEIGREFRGAIYDAIHRVREEINRR